MKLFEVVPSNFFSILVSSNREIYFDALMILHETFKDKLNILLEDYVSSLIFLLEDRAFEWEDGDDGDGDLASPSGKARLIVARLIKTGWIEKEFIENSFVEIITPRPYAIPVMKLLGQLGESGLEEYNSMVFATYSGLKQAMNEDPDHLYEAVLSARANTEELQYSMRRLYHGIRGHLRNIVFQQDVNDLLSEHFEDFKQLSDRLYHPIKTMDSVYRYIHPIQSLLGEILSDQARLTKMDQRAMGIRQYKDPQEARAEIHGALDYVLETYEGLGELIGEIDRKHASYTKNSVEKIRYLMTADQTIRGKLAQLLKAAASKDPAEQEAAFRVMEQGIKVNRQEFLDAGSLYHKNVRSRRIITESLPVDTDESLTDLAQTFLLEHIKDSYPLARIKAYARSLFKDGRSRVSVRDIPMAGDTDFILLILAVIRQDDAGMPYTIEMGEGRIQVNGYWLPDLTFIQREGDHEVE